MDWSYLIQAGKEGLSERVFVHGATLSVTAGAAINGSPTEAVPAEAMLTIDNTANVNSGDNVWIIPIAVDMICVAPGVGTFAAINLLKDNATQWVSGGVTLPPVQTSYDTRDGYSDRTAKGSVHFGDLVLTTGSARGYLGSYMLRATGQDGFLVGDHIHMRFGTMLPASFGVASVAAGAVQNISLPPVWIGRQCSMIIQPMITVMDSAASFHVNVTTVELGHPRETS